VAGDALESHSKPVFASLNRNVRYSVERGRDFTYEILGVTNAAAGQAPTVTFRIEDNGQPLNVANLTAADGALSLASRGRRGTSIRSPISPPARWPGFAAGRWSST